MSFRDTVHADNLSVFCNAAEFGDERTVLYDGEMYENVPSVMTQLKAKDRVIPSKDHAQGLFMVNAIFHFPVEKLGGNVPEKGCKIGISDDTGFIHFYYVAQSGCDLNMVRLELEAYDE